MRRLKTMFRNASVMLSLVLTTLVLTGCHDINPSAPSLTAVPLPPAQLEPSVVVMPVTYDFRGAVADLNAQVPTHAGNINSDWIEDPPGNRSKYKYEIWRRPFSLSVGTGMLRAATIIEYAAAGGYDAPILPIVTGSCGVNEPHRLVAVGTQTNVALTPAWQLQSSTSLAQLDAQNRCQLTFLNFDVTDKILDRTRGILSGNLGRLDTSIGALNLRAPVQRAWEQVRPPIQVAPRVWLQLNLDSVYFGGVAGSGTTLQTSVGTRGTPKIVYGDRPPDTATPLPSPGTPPANRGFHVALEATLPHTTVSTDISARLRGKRFYKDRLYIEIVDASIYGIGSNEAVLQVGFKGSANGRVFLTGHPSYDASSGLLSVPDLDYDVSTKNLLVKVADWLEHDDARDFFRGYTRWNATDSVRQAQAQLQRALNTDLGHGLKLSGDVSAVTPIGVWVSPVETSIRLRADGALTLNGVTP
jgi:hypothetical protein